MKLFIGETEINLSEQELNSRYLSEGSESTIYQYGNETLKIYKDNFYLKRLTEEEANRMSRIPTKRILLPKRIIYDKDKEFIGYTTPFKMEYDNSFLNRYTMGQYIDELNLLREDTRTLSHEGILLEDLHQGNILVSNELYLCDPGLYKFSNNKYEDVYRKNIMELNYLFTVLLLETGTFDLTNKEIDKLEEYFEPTTRYFIDKVVEEHKINPKQKVRPFMKSLAKRIR